MEETKRSKPSASTSVEKLYELVEAHVEELVEIDATVGELPEGPLLRLRPSDIHRVRSVRLFIHHSTAKRSNQNTRTRSTVTELSVSAIQNERELSNRSEINHSPLSAANGLRACGGRRRTTTGVAEKIRVLSCGGRRRFN